MYMCDCMFVGFFYVCDMVYTLSLSLLPPSLSVLFSGGCFVFFILAAFV